MLFFYFYIEPLTSISNIFNEQRTNKMNKNFIYLFFSRSFHLFTSRQMYTFYYITSIPIHLFMYTDTFVHVHWYICPCLLIHLFMSTYTFVCTCMLLEMSVWFWTHFAWTVEIPDLLIICITLTCAIKKDMNHRITSLLFHFFLICFNLCDIC